MEPYKIDVTVQYEGASRVRGKKVRPDAGDPRFREDDALRSNPVALRSKDKALKRFVRR